MLSCIDFHLTDMQILAIANYFASCATAAAAAGEDPPSGVEVHFSFAPGLGRLVTAHFDGAVTGHEIL